MLLSEYVEVLITNRNKKRIENDYCITCNIGEFAKIQIGVLSKGSHYLVDVSCDYCGILLNVPFKRYNKCIKDVLIYSCNKKECSNSKIKDVCMYKYGEDNPFKVFEIKEKITKSIINKYGVKHIMDLSETKDKIKKTCISKYGEDSYAKTDMCLIKTKNTNILKYGEEHHNKTDYGKEKRKMTRILNGNQIPDEILSDYYIYKRIVFNMTKISKKIFLLKWDGVDFYDGEHILNNFKLKSNDRKYPVFDHKISTYYGFKNNITPEDISNVNNLCITKNYLNCIKGAKCSDEFILYLKNNPPI